MPAPRCRAPAHGGGGLLVQRSAKKPYVFTGEGTPPKKSHKHTNAKNRKLPRRLKTAFWAAFFQISDVIRGIVHPKNENSLIICSPLCRWRSGWSVWVHKNTCGVSGVNRAADKSNTIDILLKHDTRASIGIVVKRRTSEFKCLCELSL